MIKTRKTEGLTSCGACAKGNVVTIELEYGYGHSTTLTRFCEECVKELAQAFLKTGKQLHDEEVYGEEPYMGHDGSKPENPAVSRARGAHPFTPKM